MSRLALIRHVRYLYYSWHLRRWWVQVGQHFWLTPNPRDLQFLDDVWSGKV